MDAGYGQVALHNHISNRFMKMDHEPWAFESKSPRRVGKCLLQSTDACDLCDRVYKAVASKDMIRSPKKDWNKLPPS